MGDRDSRQLLGGNTPAAFLARYWHKDALLVPAALPGLRRRRHARRALCARRARRRRVAARAACPRALLASTTDRFDAPSSRDCRARNWTLLVQGVNLHNDAADALLRRFAFVPFARLDDLMVSHAAPGGGVGPHYDSYDVFLLQASGRRRWRYGRQARSCARPGAPLKILAQFTPRHEAMLAPGDMLYLPPDYAHDGVAIDECMTYSIGFRAQRYQELAEAFLDHLRDKLDVPGRYADPGLRATHTPARIDAAMQRQVARAMTTIRWNAGDVARFLGRYLTEPESEVVFTAPPAATRERFAGASRVMACASTGARNCSTMTPAATSTATMCRCPCPIARPSSGWPTSARYRRKRAPRCHPA